MNFDQKELNRYCESMSSAPDELLKKVERETHLKTLAPQMLTGQVQGLLLEFIAQMIRPQSVLEIGTFTGYAALCMAKGLADDGILHTIEIAPEREPLIQKYLNESPHADQIQLYIGDAKTVIPEIDGSFDLVYVDGAKFDYSEYYDLVIDRVVSGGYIVTDNVLWGGKIVKGERDKDTSNMHAFNQKIVDDPRVQNVILPIRDGINLIRKL